VTSRISTSNAVRGRGGPAVFGLRLDRLATRDGRGQAVVTTASHRHAPEAVKFAWADPSVDGAFGTRSGRPSSRPSSAGWSRKQIALSPADGRPNIM